MFENLEQDGDLLGISGCPENTQHLASSLWGVLLASKRSMSDAWAMVEECRALLKAVGVARALRRDDDMPLALSAAYAGSKVIEHGDSTVDDLGALLLMIIEALPESMNASLENFENQGIDIGKPEIRSSLDPASAWLTLPKTLLPVTLSEMLAAYGLGLVDEAIVAGQKWNPVLAMENIAQAGQCFGQAAFCAGDAYKAEIQRKRASARAAIGGRAKHAQSDEAKQKAAVLKYWNENPPKGLSADAAAGVVPHEIDGLDIELKWRTLADLLRRERKAGRLLK